MNNRPKIASLTEKELGALLSAAFFIIGKDIRLPADKLKLFLGEVYKYQGGKYVDDFNEAFSKYAALELPNAETLRPQVSPLFISSLMKLYANRNSNSSPAKKTVKDKLLVLTPENKFTLFVKYITTGKSLPGNPDWVTIYEYLTGINKLLLHPEWGSMGYHHKWKYAMQTLTEWAYRNYNL